MPPKIPKRLHAYMHKVMFPNATDIQVAVAGNYDSVEDCLRELAEMDQTTHPWPPSQKVIREMMPGADRREKAWHILVDNPTLDLGTVSRRVGGYSSGDSLRSSILPWLADQELVPKPRPGTVQETINLAFERLSKKAPIEKSPEPGLEEDDSSEKKPAVVVAGEELHPKEDEGSERRFFLPTAFPTEETRQPPSEREEVSEPPVVEEPGLVSIEQLRNADARVKELEEQLTLARELRWALASRALLELCSARGYAVSVAPVGEEEGRKQYERRIDRFTVRQVILGPDTIEDLLHLLELEAEGG